MKPTKKKAAARAGATALRNTTKNHHHSGNTAEAQRDRLLCALRAGTITTLQARSKLDCMHPGARIMELRRLGHRIQTIWTTDLTPEGKPHRVAKYVLQPGGVA
jgi:hypothetical protein